MYVTLSKNKTFRIKVIENCFYDKRIGDGVFQDEEINLSEKVFAIARPSTTLKHKTKIFVMWKKFCPAKFSAFHNISSICIFIIFIFFIAISVSNTCVGKASGIRLVDPNNQRQFFQCDGSGGQVNKKYFVSLI